MIVFIDLVNEQEGSLVRATETADCSERMRRLGLRLYRNRSCVSRKMGRHFLYRSMKMDNEQAFLDYHRRFSIGKKVIDDESYRQMYLEYQLISDKMTKKRLGKYLMLGTDEQKNKVRSQFGRKRSMRTALRLCNKKEDMV